MQQVSEQLPVPRGPAVGIRAVVGFALALTVLSVHAVVAFINVQTLAENERRVRQSYEVLDAVRTTLSALQDTETGERGYVITGDDRYLAPYHSGQERFQRELGRLKNLSEESPELRGFVEQLDTIARSKLEGVSQVIEIRRKSGFEGAQQALEAGEGRLAMDDIRDLVAKMLRQEQAELLQRSRQSNAAVEVATSASLVVGLLGVGIIGIAYGLVRREIVQRRESQHSLRYALNSLTQRSQQLQRLAELSMRLGEADAAPAIVALIACESRLLIGTHQSLASAVIEASGAACLDTVSLSEKYAGWPEDRFRWRDPDVEQAVCRLNAPLRMTQAELAAHPAWRNLLADAKGPPLRGWLSAPLMGRDGRNLGLIQLSDKVDGEFTAEDEAILMQLARLSSAAIENTRLNQELQDSSRRKDEFLAMLGHELRNPLAGIVTSAQVLPMLPPGDPDRPKMQAVIERQAGHMVRMVDDLLDVSRIARGKLTLERTRLDLVQLVEQAVGDFRHSHPNDSLLAETDMPGEPLWVQADSTRLQQVVTNLIHNACKFSEPPCRLRVRLARDVQRNLAILAIRDGGIGMTRETLARIFEPFNQAENTIDRSRGGMGLGLALVKGLVHLHRGRITATSEGLGQGSEFVIELPLAVTPASSNGDGTPAEQAAQVKRVLLIDDTKDALFPLERLLSARGLQVAAAYDGPSGLELARQFRPDMILCDIGLPGMDGYAVAAAMRTDPDLQDVYLVAVTGYGQEEDRRLAREAGFDYHMTKPLSKANLDQLITACPRFDDRLALNSDA